MGSKARPKRYRAVDVDWYDATMLAYGWQSSVELHKGGGALIKSRGYLVKETADSIVIAGSVDTGFKEQDTNNFSDPVQIPRACIKRMVRK